MTLFLRGPFRAISSDGADRTPVSQKSQALLALLATSPSLKRSRVWLCDKLWSARDARHAAGSLRQALSELRRSLGPAAAILRADRRTVWLSAGEVMVDHSGTGEYLEGTDIRDPEWEDWLRGLRAADDATDDTTGDPTDTPRPAVPHDAPPVVRVAGGTCRVPAVALTVPQAVDTSGRYFAGMVIELLARNLSETTGIEADLDRTARSTLSLTLTPQVGRDGTSVALSLRRRPDGTHLWSASRAIRSTGAPRPDDLDLHALLAEAQDAIAAHYAADLPAARGPADIAAETQRAARHILSYDTRQMPGIEARLEELCDSEPNATTFGWLLLLKRIMFYEGATVATADWVERVTHRCEQAVALGNTNAFVLAAVSGAYLRLAGRPLESVELARRAVRLNPSSPFALDALASAMYLTGSVEEGCRLSAAARALTANTTYAHFFDMSLSVASLLAGRHDRAASLSDAALAIAPNFRAAWRARIALCANRGRMDEAHRAGERLAAIETGFSIDRMLRDPDYPVGVLRQTCAPGFARLDTLV